MSLDDQFYAGLLGESGTATFAPPVAEHAVNKLALDAAAEVYEGGGFKLGPRQFRERPISGMELAELDRRAAAIEDLLDPERLELLAQMVRRRVSCDPRLQVQGEHPQPAVIVDEPQQLTVDLAASNMIAVRASVGHGPVHCRIITEALAESVGPNAIPPETLTIVDGPDATYLFLVDPGYQGPRALSVVGEGAEEHVEPDHTHTSVRLPSAGTFERIPNWSGRTPRRSEFVTRLAAPRDEDLTEKVAKFIADNYQPLPEGSPVAAGLTRAALHESVLRANGLDRAFCSEPVVSAAFAATGFEKRRAAGGWRYLIQGKPGEVRTIPHIAVSSIDPGQYSAFKAWLSAQDTPTRRAKRAEEDRVRGEQAARKAEHEARWGHRSLAEVRSIITDFSWREERRSNACSIEGEDFSPMPAPHWGVPSSGPVPRYAERLAAWKAANGPPK